MECVFIPCRMKRKRKVLLGAHETTRRIWHYHSAFSYLTPNGINDVGESPMSRMSVKEFDGCWSGAIACVAGITIKANIYICTFVNSHIASAYHVGVVWTLYESKLIPVQCFGVNALDVSLSGKLWTSLPSCNNSSPCDPHLPLNRNGFHSVYICKRYC